MQLPLLVDIRATVGALGVDSWRVMAKPEVPELRVSTLPPVIELESKVKPRARVDKVKVRMNKTTAR